MREMNAQLQERGPDYNLDFAAQRWTLVTVAGDAATLVEINNGLLKARIPSGTRRCSGPLSPLRIAAASSSITPSGTSKPTARNPPSRGRPESRRW